MKEIMDIEECQRKYLREISLDSNKITSIIKVVNARLKAIKQIKKDEETTSIIIEGYYEAIKELLVALLLKNGLKSENHECLISFFKNKFRDYDYEVQSIHELKNIRNRINYDGFFVKPEYLMRNESEFNHIINLLKKLIE